MVSTIERHLADLLKPYEEVVRAAKENEWTDEIVPNSGIVKQHCTECWATKEEGHTKGCKIGTALKALEDQK